LEYKIRVHPSERQTYIPKALVESLGSELTIFPDKVAAILYRTGEDPAVVIASVRVLLRHLELDARLGRNKRRRVGSLEFTGLKEER
jgi:hypothetical protein